MLKQELDKYQRDGDADFYVNSLCLKVKWGKGKAFGGKEKSAKRIVF